MRTNKKLKAGALQFVLFIGAVIAVLLLTFVLLHHTHHLFDKKTTKTIEIVKKADLAIQYAMKQNLQSNDSVELSLDTEDGIKVTVEKSYWGMFEKYTAVSEFQKNQFVKTALVGGALEVDFPALYLKDNDRPMVIVGRSRITGNAHLPQQGIRPGGIGGHFYQFRSPVFGSIKGSSKNMPLFDEGLKASLRQLLNQETYGFGNEQVRYKKNMQLINSFQSPTQYIMGDVLELSGVNLTGNIVVLASGLIVVEANSKLNDVVLVAPRIIFKNGFRGALQAIASQEIKVGRNVVLDYPSALVVDRGNLPNSKDERIPNILIEKNASVRGIVSYFGESDETSFFPQLRIAEKAMVHGEVYCDKNLELKGTVLGKVSTHNFIALENGSVYQNHLFNGTIDSSTLPTKFAGLLLNNGKTVAKWLY